MVEGLFAQRPLENPPVNQLPQKHFSIVLNNELKRWYFKVILRFLF
jgi:hypothetical protein